VLPEARKVGEPQIDHLDLVILDCAEDVFWALAIVRHRTFLPSHRPGAFLPRGILYFDSLRSRKKGLTGRPNGIRLKA
jgi:hypothetical protein